MTKSAGRTPAAAPLLFDCFAIVSPGLETLALAEARTLDLPAELEAGGGGIAWRGDLRSVLLANAGLRIASRVVVRVARFEARSFAELRRRKNIQCFIQCQCPEIVRCRAAPDRL